MANEKAVSTKVDHKNIYAALSALQGELQPIEQSSTVEFKKKDNSGKVSFKYAPLGKIMEVLYPLLAKHGLSVRHELTTDSVECILTHETAEEKSEVMLSTDSVFEEVEDKAFREPRTERTQYGTVRSNELRSGKLLIDTKKSEMKEVGAQITYARRYTLGVVLGLSTEEDKDAELLEQGNKNLSNFAFNQAKQNLEKASGEQLEKQVIFIEKELATAQAVADGTGKKAPSLGLSVEQYNELMVIGKARMAGESSQDQPAGGQE